MNSRLKAGKRLSRGVRRAARRQIGRVIARLEEPAAERRDAAIHKARQGLKQVRATLRLARPALGGREWRREDRVFRDAGHALAQARDAEVLLAALAKLRGDAREDFAPLESWLRERERAASAGLGALAKRCASDLAAARRQARDWPVKGLDWAGVCRAIQRAYRRGFKAFGEAGRTGNPEQFHEWRKRVKDLWHQLRLVRLVKPGGAPGFIAGLKRLGARLGDDHDLAMLERAARGAELDRPQFKLLANLVRERRAGLQREALELGRRLYAQEPAAFGHELRARGKKRRR